MKTLPLFPSMKTNPTQQMEGEETHRETGGSNKKKGGHLEFSGQEGSVPAPTFKKKRGAHTPGTR